MIDERVFERTIRGLRRANDDDFLLMIAEGLEERIQDETSHIDLEDLNAALDIVHKMMRSRKING